jgi:hypothetical protein
VTATAMTAAERKAKQRAAAYQVAVMLRDPEAIKALGALWAHFGSQREAIEQALRIAAGTLPPDPSAG